MGFRKNDIVTLHPQQDFWFHNTEWGTVYRARHLGEKPGEFHTIDLVVGDNYRVTRGMARLPVGWRDWGEARQYGGGGYVCIEVPGLPFEVWVGRGMLVKV